MLGNFVFTFKTLQLAKYYIYLRHDVTQSFTQYELYFWIITAKGVSLVTRICDCKKKIKFAFLSRSLFLGKVFPDHNPLTSIRYYIIIINNYIKVIKTCEFDYKLIT